MTASEEFLALDVLISEAGEGKYAPLNFRSRLIEENLVLLHKQFQIP